MNRFVLVMVCLVYLVPVALAVLLHKKTIHPVNNGAIDEMYDIKTDYFASDSVYADGGLPLILADYSTL